MYTFAEFINGRGNVSDDAKALAAKVEAEFRKAFPNGWIQFKPQFLGGAGFNLYFGIIGNKSELTSGILMNDPAYHSMGVSPGQKGYDVELSQGRLNLNPEKGSGMAMSSVKFGFRKFSGDDKKIVDGFSKYFAKMKSVIKSNGDNVYRRSEYSDKYFS